MVSGLVQHSKLFIIMSTMTLPRKMVMKKKADIGQTVEKLTTISLKAVVKISNCTISDTSS